MQVSPPVYLPRSITTKFPNPSASSPLSVCIEVWKFAFVVIVVNDVPGILHLWKFKTPTL